MMSIHVLDWRGRDLWAHDKCSVFRITREGAAGMPGEVLSACGLDGPLGRMAVLICLDFCGDEIRDQLLATEVEVLRLLDGCSPQRAGVLADQLGVKRSEMSRLLGRLQAAGLILRQRAGKAVWVMLMERGKSMNRLLGPPPAAPDVVAGPLEPPGTRVRLWDPDALLRPVEL